MRLSEQLEGVGARKARSCASAESVLRRDKPRPTCPYTPRTPYVSSLCPNWCEIRAPVPLSSCTVLLPTPPTRPSQSSCLTHLNSTPSSHPFPKKLVAAAHVLIPLSLQLDILLFTPSLLRSRLLSPPPLILILRSQLLSKPLIHLFSFLKRHRMKKLWLSSSALNGTGQTPESSFRRLAGSLRGTRTFSASGHRPPFSSSAPRASRTRPPVPIAQRPVCMRRPSLQAGPHGLGSWLEAR